MWVIYFINLYLLILFTYFVQPPPHASLPSGDPQFVFCIYKSVLFV